MVSQELCVDELDSTIDDDSEELIDEVVDVPTTDGPKDYYEWTEMYPDPVTLVDYEKPVKYFFNMEHGLGNNTYLALHKLAEKVLIFKYKLKSRREINEVAHEYCVTVFMRLSKGTVITSWTKYTILSLRYILSKHWDNNKQHVAVEINDSLDLADFNERMYSHVHEEEESMNKLNVDGYFRGLAMRIAELVKEYSRYTDALHNRRLTLTILYSFYSSYRRSVFEDNSDYMYAMQLYRLFDPIIKKEILELIPNTELTATQVKNLLCSDGISTSESGDD